MAHKDKNQRLQEKYQAILSGMLREEENKYCADCDAKGPRWASWNLGIFLCIRCAGIHRKLGVHISKVKSINLDQWTAEQIASVQAVGNSKAKAIYEHSLSDNYRRSQSDTAMEQFIRAKYETQKWILPGFKPQTVIIPPDLYEDDRDSAKKSSTKQIELPKPPESKKSDTTTKVVASNKSTSNPPPAGGGGGVVASSKIAAPPVDTVLFSFDDNEPNLFNSTGKVVSSASASSSTINQVTQSAGPKSNLDEIEFEFNNYAPSAQPAAQSQQSAQQPNLFGGPDKTIDNIMAMFKTIPTSQSSMNIGASGPPPSLLPSSNSNYAFAQTNNGSNNHFQGMSDPFANNIQRVTPLSSQQHQQQHQQYQPQQQPTTAANIAFANLIPSNYNNPAVKMTNASMFPPSQQQHQQQHVQQFPNLFAPTTTTQSTFGLINPITPANNNITTVNNNNNNNLFSNTLSSDLWQ